MNLLMEYFPKDGKAVVLMAFVVIVALMVYLIYLFKKGRK